MRTHIELTAEAVEPLPAHFTGQDVRYSPNLVRYLLDRFTQPGDVVFDPFTGFGTTLIVAEGMGRIAFGIEWEADRVAYVRSRMKSPERLQHGDTRRLATDTALPPFDFSLTSPPYMGRRDSEDPLTAYSVAGNGYESYLRGLRDIYKEIGSRMTESGSIVIEAANLKANDGTVTTLAWDIAASVSEVLRFEGEIVVGWQPTYGFGYDHSYCLVFKK